MKLLKAARSSLRSSTNSCSYRPTCRRLPVPVGPRTSDDLFLGMLKNHDAHSERRRRCSERQHTGKNGDFENVYGRAYLKFTTV